MKVLQLWYECSLGSHCPNYRWPRPTKLADRLVEASFFLTHGVVVKSALKISIVDLIQVRGSACLLQVESRTGLSTLVVPTDRQAVQGL